MLGEQEALVVDVRTLDVHGVTYTDVVVAYRDRSAEQARLGPEAVPPGLATGDRILVTRVANMIVSIRRP